MNPESLAAAGASQTSFPVPKPDRLLCFDFDGTMVDSANGRLLSVENSLVERIEALRAAGAAWVVNTGRTLDQALEGLDAHEFPITPDFLITEETILLHRCPEDSWIPLGDWLDRRNLAHREVENRAARLFEAVREFVGQKLPGAVYLATNGGVDEVITRDEPQMERLCEFIDAQRASRDHLDVGFQRNTIYLRFGHRDFSKGSTLAELAKMLGLGPEQIFAAGDNHNDLPMLSRSVAHAIACPSNALPIVQDIVREEGGFVASTPHGRGLTEALSFFFDR